MRKRHLFWIIPSSLILAVFLAALIGHIISPVPSKKLVTKSKAKKILTEKELDEDLDYLKYYMTTIYCGYPEMVEKGYDIDKIIADIKKDCDKDKHGKTYDSGTLISAAKKHIINNHAIEDQHFAISGSSKFPYYLYYSDIYVEAVESGEKTKYIVLRNEREKMPEKKIKALGKYVPANIKPGQEYTGPDTMLFDWFDGNKKIYRIGTLSRQNLNNLSLLFDGKKVTVPVITNDRLDTAGKLQGMRETKDTLYISLVNFVFNGGSVMGEQEFKTLCENAKNKSVGKKQVIIDLRSNGGGELWRAAMLYTYLFYNKTENISYDLITFISNMIDDGEHTVMSPEFAKNHFYWNIKNSKEKIKKMKFRKQAKEQETDFMRYEKAQIKIRDRQLFWPCLAEMIYPYQTTIKYKSTKPKISELPPADFSGDIYFLTDKYSASCSEYSLAFLNKLAENAHVKIHHLGENTQGAVFYIDPCTKVLPNSGLWLYIPTARSHSQAFNHPSFHGEGYGWFPEYWVTHYNLLNTLNNLIDDPELTEALQGIEKWQLQ
ncbi:MAG: hypothetical protein K6G09_09750 [Treponema sp.]|nr:hypothetical protein [Treponema sp.]